MRNAIGFLSGVAMVVLLAVAMDSKAQTEPPSEFDAVTWAQSEEGAEKISGYLGAGIFFPIMGYSIGFACGALLRMIGGR